LEEGHDILADFQVNMKVELLDLDIDTARQVYLGNGQSKKEHIMARVLQANVFTKLKLSLEMYMNQNNLTGVQVCTFFLS